MMDGTRRLAPFTRFAALAGVLALAACGGGTRTMDGSMAEQLNRCRAASAHIYEASGFSDYVGRVRSTAQRCGIGSRGLAALGAVEQRAALDTDRFPPGLSPQEAALPRGEYRERTVNPTRRYVEDRIEKLSPRGRELLDRHRSLLQRVEARWGVPAEYIVAFWGVETNFGGFMGTHDVVETLANLGHGSSRRRFFTEELLGALILLDRGHVQRGFKGSYAGAFGHAQFMPTSYIQNAVDVDGDGRADLFGSLPDVFASIANYEVQRGRWDSKVGSAIFEVRLPADFDHREADIENRRDVGHWVSRRVTRADGAPLPGSLGQTAILLPAGCNGPAFMVTQNFYAVMDYNPLVEYAMAVTMLAETMRAGEYRLARAWPEENALGQSGRAELQQALNRRGYADLKVDGKIGRESRSAIRQAQAALGQCADGYANAALLAALESGDRRPTFARQDATPREFPRQEREAAPRRDADRRDIERQDATPRRGLFPATASTKTFAPAPRAKPAPKAKPKPKAKHAVLKKKPKAKPKKWKKPRRYDDD
jgi:membrane-bound lytic murein transglycosylase B